MDEIRITKRLPGGGCHVLMAELHWKQFYTESADAVTQWTILFEEAAQLLEEVEVAANSNLGHRVYITGNDLPMIIREKV